MSYKRTLKGIGWITRWIFCWKVYKINSVSFEHAQTVFEFLAYLLKEKNNETFFSCLLLWKLTIPEDCSRKPHKISVPVFFLFHWGDFLQCTYIYGRLSEQFSGSHAAFGKPEQASWRGLLEEFSQLLSDSLKQAETLFWTFFCKRQPEIVEIVSAHIKSTVLIFRAIKKYKIFISWHYHLKMSRFPPQDTNLLE